MSPACVPPRALGSEVPESCQRQAASCRSFEKFVLRNTLALFADPSGLPKVRNKPKLLKHWKYSGRAHLSWQEAGTLDWPGRAAPHSRVRAGVCTHLMGSIWDGASSVWGLAGCGGDTGVLGGTERGPQRRGKAAGFGEESRFPPVPAGMGAGSLWPLEGRVWSRVAAKEPCCSIGKGRLAVPYTGTGCAVQDLEVIRCPWRGHERADSAKCSLLRQGGTGQSPRSAAPWSCGSFPAALRGHRGPIISLSPKRDSPQGQRTSPTQQLEQGLFPAAPPAPHVSNGQPVSSHPLSAGKRRLCHSQAMILEASPSSRPVALPR